MCANMAESNPDANYVMRAEKSLPDRYQGNPLMVQMAKFEGAKMRRDEEAGLPVQPTFGEMVTAADENRSVTGTTTSGERYG